MQLELATVKRGRLLACLKLLEGAVSPLYLRELDRAFIFRGDRMYSNNGHSSCVVYYETGLNCGIEAKSLLGLAGKTGPLLGPYITSLVDEDEITLKHDQEKGKLIWSEGKQ